MNGWLTRASRWGLVLLGLGSTACPGPVKPNDGAGTFHGRQTINLFGMQDAERHLIEVGTVKGQLFLLHADPETGSLDWVDCPLETPYEYQQHPMRTQTIEIRSTAELAATLPLSQSQFQASIESGNWYEFRWAAVGSYTPGKFQLPRTNTECARATHFVKLLTVGAVNWSEMSGTKGGASIDAKVAKIGGSFATGSSDTNSMGDFSACFKDASGESGDDCKIPLQVSVAELRDHHWCPVGNTACEESTRLVPSSGCDGPAPAPSCLPKPATGPVRGRPEEEIIPIYRGQATASRYMSEGMERAFLLRSSASLRGYGYANEGALLMAGLVKAGGELETEIPVTAGQEYAIVAGGDSDAQDLDLVVKGAASASDSGDSRDSVATFRAATTGTATVILKGSRINSAEGSFVSILILKKGGHALEADGIRATILQTLERGELVSDKLQATRFHENQFAFYVVAMTGGLFRQPGLDLPIGTTFAFATADAKATDIDIGLVSGEELKEVDSEGDSLPIVGAERSSVITAELLIGSEGKELTVIAASLLEKVDGSTAAQECDTGDYSSIKVGTRIVLGRHTPHAGDDNWADEMAEYVGKSATVTELAGKDKQGCSVVRVDIDESTYGWRLRDAKVDDSAGIPTEGILSYGRWLIAKRGDKVIVWRADQKVAGEFWDGSNGWWNFLTGGKTFTVWSAGTKDPDPDTFKSKPWSGGPAPKKASEPEYRSGAQVFKLSGDSITVTMADGGAITFKSDGSVVFKTYSGSTLKM